MKADGKNTFIEKGDTGDIIENVLTTFEDSWQQCKEFAKQFYDSANLIYTCRNIFNFCINEIRYKEDPNGKQYIKTPARLIEDRVGDCKSFAILIASILRCLNIDACFRFVRFEGNSNFTHVYIVTVQNNYIIDPVERISYDTKRKLIFTDINSGQPKFNIARPYAEKIDYMNKTDIYRLSGIGNTDTETVLPEVLSGIDAWTDGKPFYEQTEAENEINSFVDLAMSEYSVTGDRTALDNIDRLLTTKFLLRQPDKKLAAQVLQKMEDDNLFVRNLPADNTKRADNLDYLQSVAVGMYKHPAETELPVAGGAMDFFSDLSRRHIKPNSDFVARYKAVVENSKTVSLGMTEQEAKNQLVIKIKQSGFGFLYCFLSDDVYNKAASANPIIGKKRNEEIQMMQDWANDLKESKLNYTSIFTYVKSGCMATVLMTVDEYFIKSVKLGKFPEPVLPRIGEPFAIITAIIGIVSAIIALIGQIVQTVTSDPSNFPQSVPDHPDITQKLKNAINGKSGSGNDNNDKASTVNPLLLVAGGLALFSIFKSKKGESSNGTN